MLYRIYSMPAETHCSLDETKCNPGDVLKSFFTAEAQSTQSCLLLFGDNAAATVVARMKRSVIRESGTRIPLRSIQATPLDPCLRRDSKIFRTSL